MAVESEGFTGAAHRRLAYFLCPPLPENARYGPERANARDAAFPQNDRVIPRIVPWFLYP